MLSSKLAEVLGVTAGDNCRWSCSKDRDPCGRVIVVSLVDEYMGTSVYMEIAALQRFMREGPTMSGPSFLVDKGDATALYRRIKATPAVAGVSSKRAAIDNFRDTIAQNLNVMIFFNVLFSSVIAFGVVYNAARISLSERSRELASLRVLGFTRAEISLILLGELAVILLVAVPAGLLLGYGLAALVRGGIRHRAVSFSARRLCANVRIRRGDDHRRRPDLRSRRPRASSIRSTSWPC